MKARLGTAILSLALALGAASPVSARPAAPASYLDSRGRADAATGGITMVPITTPKGVFHVWVHRTGNNPRLKVLLLHGGPGGTSDYFAAFDSFFPAAGIEYYTYDQLGAGRSDHPDDDSLWTIERFVSEVDQVRKAIGGNASNLCVLGHSWGGILAMEYALAHQQDIKCLVISNMMASIPAYNHYADTVLKPRMNPADLKLVEQLEKDGKTDDPRFMGILMPQYYEKHILQRPASEWPEPVVHANDQTNKHIYTLMQGPSELGASGVLAQWDRFADLHRITLPTLVISGSADTMDPAYMKAMAGQLPHGSLLATKGGHMAMYDDQQAYFRGLIAFLEKQGIAAPKKPAS